MNETIRQAGIHGRPPIQFRVSNFLEWRDGVEPVKVETISTLGAGRHTVILRHVNEDGAAAYIEIKKTAAEASGLINLELDGLRIRISRKDGTALTHEDLKIFNQFPTSGFEE